MQHHSWYCRQSISLLFSHADRQFTTQFVPVVTIPFRRLPEPDVDRPFGNLAAFADNSACAADEDVVLRQHSRLITLFINIRWQPRLQRLALPAAIRHSPVLRQTFNFKLCLTIAPSTVITLASTSDSPCYTRRRPNKSMLCCTVLYELTKDKRHSGAER